MNVRSTQHSEDVIRKNTAEDGDMSLSPALEVQQQEEETVILLRPSWASVYDPVSENKQ